MKILKFILSEETLLGDGKTDPYRRRRDIYDMEGNLLYSFDPMELGFDSDICNVFK